MQLKVKSEVATQNKNPFGILQMLHTLKDDDELRPLFEHYTFSKDSLSLQGGTLLQPRALLFESTAQFITTFTDHWKGRYALETSDFDFNKDNILFREIIAKEDLPEELKAQLGGKNLKDAPEEVLDHELDLKASEIEFENEKFAVTIANPQKCMNCHALFPNEPKWTRYIEDGYNRWPRMYGEFDDSLTEKEVASFEEFKRTADDRYRTLIGFESKYYPFHIGPPRSASIDVRPNGLLNIYLGILQAKVLARYVREHQSVEKLLRFSYQQECYGPDFLHSILEPLRKTPDSDIEAIMALDRQTLTHSLGGRLHTGLAPIRGLPGLGSLTQQELYFALNPVRAEKFEVENSYVSKRYYGTLSAESYEFIHTRLDPKNDIDAGLRELKLKTFFSYFIDCEPPRSYHLAPREVSDPMRPNRFS